MTTKLRICLVCSVLFIVTCIVGCRSTDSGDEQPDFKASSLMLTGTLEQVVSAITNALGKGAYHGTRLVDCPYDYQVQGNRRVAVPQTNAWILACETMPLTLIPRGGKMVPYMEEFNIKADAVSQESTRLSVKPAGSATWERSYSFSPHFVRVLGEKYHPPVASETTNLFHRIERQLAGVQAGRTNALPQTPDTAPGYYLRFWTSMDAKQRHDRRNWERMVEAWKELQGGHNPQGGANGRQPFASEADGTSATAASRRSP